MISALTHPSFLRAMSRSKVEEVEDYGEGTFYGLVTTDVGLTRTALRASPQNCLKTIEVLGHRKIRPADRNDYLPRVPRDRGSAPYR